MDHSFNWINICCWGYLNFFLMHCLINFAFANFYYMVIQKLCPNCFGPHPKKVCHSQKSPWIRYLANFVEWNPDIPREIYGRWTQIIKGKLALCQDNHYQAVQEMGAVAVHKENIQANKQTESCSHVLNKSSTALPPRVIWTESLQLIGC